MQPRKRTTSEITSFFEISFIVRLLYDVPPRSFSSVFPHLLVYISWAIATLPAVTSRIRKNDVPDDTMSVLRTDPYCQLLLAYVSWFQPVVVKVTKFHLAEAAGTRVFHRRPTKFCFNFRISSRNQRSWNSCKIASRSYVDNKSLNTLTHVILARTSSQRIRQIHFKL